jgi:hypothetical protein
LVENLRQHAGFPLTVVVHGWGTPSAREFVDLLTNVLELRNDAIWLIPQEGYPQESAGPNLERIVILDVLDETDMRIYRNLVPDLIYFPAISREEAEKARRFRQCTHSVLIDHRGQHWQTVCAEVRETEVSAFLWAGANMIDFLQTAGSQPSQETARTEKKLKATILQSGDGAEETAPNFDKVGRELADLAVELTPSDTRRHRFRTSLLELIARYPGHPNWYESLARQADIHCWPFWAVQCLPVLFIPLPDPSHKEKVAIVWKYLGSCLPNHGILEVETLCSGELRKLVMSPEDSDSLARFGRVVADRLSSNPYWGEGSFNGMIVAAFAEIESNLRPFNPEAADRVREVQKQFLFDANIMDVTKR